MADEFVFDQAVTLAQAAAGMKNWHGKRVSLATIRRWASDGCKPRDGGPPVVLQAVMVGHCLWTMPQWVKRFVDEVIDRGKRIKTKWRTPNEAAASHQQAVAALESRGMQVGGPA